MKLFIYLFFLIIYILFNSVQVANVLEPQYVLRSRLNLVNDVYVRFIQKINFDDVKKIEVIRGELWIKRPNLFHWHVTEPQENFLISDGKILWFYVPIIKQVTIYCLQDVISDNIFLKLLFTNDPNIWENYVITQEKDWFYLKPVYYDNDSVKQFKIKITNRGIIDQFSIVTKNKQHIDYYLSDQCVISLIDKDKFRFILSDDLQLDDQRVQFKISD